MAYDLKLGKKKSKVCWGETREYGQYPSLGGQLRSSSLGMSTARWVRRKSDLGMRTDVVRRQPILNKGWLR